MAGGRGALARIAFAAFARAMSRGQAGFDAIVHTGDLFNRSEPPATAIAAALDVITRVARDVPIVVIAGNHDRHGLTRSLGEPPPGVTIVDTPRVVVLGGLRLGCLPHARLADAWAGQAAMLADQGVDALAAHQSFDGMRVPGFVFRAGRSAETVGASGIPAGVTHVLCGHLHPRQTARVGPATVVCAGSTVRTSFREGDPPKGTVAWEFGARTTYAFEPLPSPRWTMVRARADLADVGPGAVVRLARDAPAELAAIAAARGAIVLGAEIIDDGLPFAATA